MDRASIQERFGITGDSAAIRNVIDRAWQVAQTDITVLLQGESGVGKELIAHAIHALSRRKHGPLIIVNCGAIPEGLIESELFGAEKGAYTGAVEKRSGYFEEANGGSIFLDEVGEMPMQAQVRLLRVLESGEYSRVGSATSRTTDVRVIAATNKDLAREVEAGRFREDLYYRLSTVLIKIPPLRERKEDIVPLFMRFLHTFSQKYNSSMKRLDDSARDLLTRYRWPGNVRELRNVAEQAVVLLRGDTLSSGDLESYLRGVSAARTSSEFLPVLRDRQGDAAEARERELIYRALLELRMEMRELKEQVGLLRSSMGVALPRDVVEGSDLSADRGNYVIVRDAVPERFSPLIEDVPFEIEADEGRGDAPPGTDHGTLGNGTSEPAARDEARAAGEGLPTLEDAERDLITRALKRFDGNRRQTAKALGISERTLYRKLKDLDEDL